MLPRSSTCSALSARTRSLTTRRRTSPNARSGTTSSWISRGTIRGGSVDARSPRAGHTCSAGSTNGRSGHRWFGSLGRFAKLIVISPFVSELHPFRGTKDPGDRLVLLKELIEAGKVTPVIDRTFPLSEVPDAIRYLETGQARGKVVITVGD